MTCGGSMPGVEAGVTSASRGSTTSRSPDRIKSRNDTSPAQMHPGLRNTLQETVSSMFFDVAD